MLHFAMGWLRCLSLPTKKLRLVSDQPSDEIQQPCVFCGVSVANGFDVVWENEVFIAFRDHRPAALHHIQLIPKKHIDSVKSLSKADVQLVQTMEEIGHRILDDLGVTRELRRLGFHIPPFNTVNHLHLHVQTLPYKSFYLRLKYPVISIRGQNTKYHKGFSWFAEIGQVIRILEEDGRVGLLRC